MFFKQAKPAKCIDGSNFFPEGDRGVLNAVLSGWCEDRYDSEKSAKIGKYGRTYCQEQGIPNAALSIHTEHGNGELPLPGIGGSPGKNFNSCQTQGNPFSFSFLIFSPKDHQTYEGGFSFSFSGILGDCRRQRQRHIPAKSDLSISNLRVQFFHEPKMCEMGYAKKLSSKTGYTQLKGRAMPTIYCSKGTLRTNTNYNIYHRSSRLYLKSYINLGCNLLGPQTRYSKYGKSGRVLGFVPFQFPDLPINTSFNYLGFNSNKLTNLAKHSFLII